ncbi:hypothetical protein Droror1_Dr00012149 [Drosera rotundifolia]
MGKRETSYMAANSMMTPPSTLPLIPMSSPPPPQSMRVEDVGEDGADLGCGKRQNKKSKCYISLARDKGKKKRDPR